MRRLAGSLFVVAVLVGACGGGEVTISTGAAPTTAADSSVTQPGSSSTTAAVQTVPTTEAPAASFPSVAALTSGRGDDGSLEVGVWFVVDPFELEGVRVRVGTDDDDSYPGVGDPVPHIDAWSEADGSALTLVEGDDVVASTATGLDDWLTWTGPGRTVWWYFLGNVPVRAGTVWVIVDVAGDSPPGAIAGAPLGTGCSYHDAGIDIGPVPADVPRHGACRYPGG